MCTVPLTAFDDVPLRRYEEAMSVIQACIDEQDYLKKQQGGLYSGNGKVLEQKKDAFEDYSGMN